MNAAVQLAHRAFDFGVPFVADHDELETLPVQLGHFHMHFGHQRAGRVKNLKTARARLDLHGTADTVRRKNKCRSAGHFIQRFNKDSALGLEVVHDIGVVHNLVAHINRGAKFLQGMLDDLDGPIHTSAKATRLGQQDVLR